jgi:hypothetical protein
MKWRPRCETCKFWEQKYPQNKQLGACNHMGILLWEDNKMASVSVVPAVEDGMREPTSDVESVNTRAEFGCAEHSDYQL